jgi:FKBP-type peptidyl-prolyl cis-trans isomerase 2
MRYRSPVKIEKGRRVRVKVRLQVEGGEVIEESVVEYFHGAGTMLRGLEQALEGLETGAKRKGTIPPKDAFGNEDQLPVKKMARAEFPKDAKLDVGAQFTAKGANNGLDVILKIVKASKDELEVRLLHPLADKAIAYEAEVVKVSDPTPPPLPGAALDVEVDS